MRHRAPITNFSIAHGRMREKAGLELRGASRRRLAVGGGDRESWWTGGWEVGEGGSALMMRRGRI
jgi:hypothetical protein